MKKKACDCSNSDKDDPKQKERHIVSWSEEDDDILREQIRIHGTNNWAIIASKFENKTTRQCRRRWFTYLNSDFKKGGWSHEEDMLLCQAQKIFGNRWTEIAKVVPGRTDNAVKNRFSILSKKKEKCESSTKENNNGVNMNTNNKRTRQNTDKILETSMQHMNIRRKQIVATMEDCDAKEQKVRPPFVVILQNCMKPCIEESSGNTVEGKSLIELNQGSPETISSKTIEKANDLCDGRKCPLPNSEFNSPLQVTPLFRSMAEGIPSPQFSESERNFLLKTLGMESAIPNPTSRTSQSPPCKRALLHCL
ncbi:transcription factor MYB124 [Lactuca sativa]|uniref:Uncharacterized protein n=1 Tax=Lactuca sativa TaxID=4236 RepID=A0A9R1XTW5_LACSA|nr:transcription factor MYB124 [Lactuca sativa]KAJ0219137.1 hypothetical protein LSAT_V11C300121890 [Lactuca sativa]